MNESNLKPGGKKYCSDGILFGKKRGGISTKVMNDLDSWNWKRIDVFYDFKKYTLAIRNNDEGMLKIQGHRKDSHGYCFSAGGFSNKAKRGRYMFLKKQGDMYVFTYKSKK